MARSYYKFIFNFLRICQTIFQSGWPLCIPLVVYVSATFSASLSTLGMASLLKYSHSERHVSYCGFLHFSNSSQCLVSLHVLICYLYIFFGEVFSIFFPCFFFFFTIAFWEFFIFFQYKSFTRNILCKYFPHPRLIFSYS